MGLKYSHKTAISTGPRLMMKAPYQSEMTGLFDLRSGSLRQRLTNLVSPLATPGQTVGDVAGFGLFNGYMHFQDMRAIDTMIKVPDNFTLVVLGRQTDNSSGLGPTFIGNFNSELDPLLRGVGVSRAGVSNYEFRTSANTSGVGTEFRVQMGTSIAPLGWKAYGLSVGPANMLTQLTGLANVTTAFGAGQVPTSPQRNIRIGFGYNAASGDRVGPSDISMAAIYKSALTHEQIAEIRTWMFGMAARFGIVANG